MYRHNETHKCVCVCAYVLCYCIVSYIEWGHLVGKKIYVIDKYGEKTVTLCMRSNFYGISSTICVVERHRKRVITLRELYNDIQRCQLDSFYHYIQRFFVV